MFPLSASMNAISSLLGIGQPKTEQESNGADGFSALLDIGTEVVEPQAAPAKPLEKQAGKDSGTPFERPKDKEEDAQPVAAEVVVPLRVDTAKRYLDEEREAAPAIEARQLTPQALKEDAPEREGAQPVAQAPATVREASSPAPQEVEAAPVASVAPVPVEAEAATAQPASVQPAPVVAEPAATVVVAEVPLPVVAAQPVVAVSAPVVVAPVVTPAAVVAPAQTSVAAVVGAQDVSYMKPVAVAVEVAAPSAAPSVAAPVTQEALPAELATMIASFDELLSKMDQLMKDTPVLQAVEMGTGKPLSPPIMMGEGAAKLEAMLQQFLGSLSEGTKSLLAQAQTGEQGGPAIANMPRDVATSLSSMIVQLQNVLAGLGSITTTEAVQKQAANPAALPVAPKPVSSELAAALGKLFALVQPQGAEDATLTPMPLAETSTAFTTSQKLSEQIAQLRDTFAAITDSRAPAEAKLQAAIEAPVVPGSVTTEAATDSAIVKEASANNTQAIAAKTSAELASNATIASVAAQPAAPQPVTTSNTAVAHNTAVAAAQVEASARGNSSGGDFGGQSQQQQGAPAAASAPAAGAVAGSEHSYKNSFTAAMEKAANPSPVHEQVAFHVKTALADGSSKITIRLDPAELGKLDIKLQVGADGKTSVVITADSKSTLDLLQRDAQGLMRALQDSGLQADSSSLNFNLRGGQQENQHERAQVAQTYQKAQPEEDLDLAANVLTRSYVVNLASGLDIKI